MCNCIKETQDRAKNNLSEKNEGYKEKLITNVEIQNVSIMFGCKQSTQLYSPIIIEYDILNKKDILMHKKEKANFIYKYCPFCGEKYEL